MTNMTPKTIVLTGGSDGIGAAAARRLSRSGHRVVLVGRSPSKTTAVAEEIGADYFVTDFADLSQVRALAEKIRAEYPRIDVLANNAGAMTKYIEMTPDGLEQTYQVNYLSPFLLTTQLLDLLVDSRATVLNTTSSSQRLVPRFRVADLEDTARRRPSAAYALTKLAIVMFTMELHRRYHSRGLSAVTFHPGMVSNTNFGNASGSVFLRWWDENIHFTNRYFTTVEEGAEPLIRFASTQPGTDWTPGVYYSKRKIAKANRAAHNPALTGELWERTLARLS
jgi:NAD(P)-dependent dehydrogenase (short-subunit alcohol dehydrogenase family)